MTMKFIDNLEGLVTSKLAITKTIWTLFKLETKLAGLGLYGLLVNVCAIIALSIVACSSILVLIGYLVTLLTGSILAGILVVMVLTIGSLIYTVQRIPLNLQQLSFEKTRASLTSHSIRDTHDNQEPSIDPTR
jgi:cobalamin biosynthesis protein CobD/CbiB